MTTWTWAKASVKGTSHIRAGTRCQDSSVCDQIGRGRQVLAAIVSDGAGSAEFGGEGSALVCRNILQSARQHFQATNQPPTDEQIWSWIDQVRDSITLAATRREIASRQFAATLVAVFVTPQETLLLHIGDGAAVLKVGDDWIVPSWPENGEYASMTFFITDDPVPRLRITRSENVASGVAVFSDGLEKLLLDFAAAKAHAPFFAGIFSPLLASGVNGRDTGLSSGLAKYLDSEAVNSRTDDDKSLILAVRK